MAHFIILISVLPRVFDGPNIVLLRTTSRHFQEFLWVLLGSE